MDSWIAWFLLLGLMCFGAFTFTTAVLAELNRKNRESEADWIRLETEWGR